MVGYRLQTFDCRWIAPHLLSLYNMEANLCSQIFAPIVQKLVLKETGINWRSIVLFHREFLSNRILIWLIHMHMNLCLKFFLSLSQSFERDCFCSTQLKNIPTCYTELLTCKTVNECMQSINVRSRLILIGVKSQNSVLILRGVFTNMAAIGNSCFWLVDF
jgi:hypothetical protein